MLSSVSDNIRLAWFKRSTCKYAGTLCPICRLNKWLIVDTLQEQITISAGEVSVRPAQN